MGGVYGGMLQKGAEDGGVQQELDARSAVWMTLARDDGRATTVSSRVSRSRFSRIRRYSSAEVSCLGDSGAAVNFLPSR
jgi:hypothetical protein